MYIYHLERAGIPFYIGRTSNINGRLSAHKKRFGIDIQIKIIDECDYDDSRDLETKYILEYAAKYELKNRYIGTNWHELKKKKLSIALTRMRNIS